MQTVKLSRYIISADVIDQKDNIQKKVIFSTRTSKMRIIDFTSWKHLEEKNFEHISQEVFEDLSKNKFLIDKNENETLSVLEENKEEINNGTHFYTVIQPTAACPLGCGYCGQLHSPKGLSVDNQVSILHYMRRKLSSKNYKSMSICWFGGEPLSGISIIDKLSPEVQALALENSLSYSASIVTNGLLLNKDIGRRLIDDHAVNKIEFTLDGIQEYHDQRRHLKTGGGTFEKIYKNLANLIEIAPSHVNITVRCNVDERNKDGISPLLQKLAQDNLHKRIQVYFAQIHSWGNDAHKLAAKKEDFAQWEINWLIEMHELGFKCNYLPERKKRLCIAVDPSSILVDPFGNVFNCTEVSLVPSYEHDGENIYKLGHISEDNFRYSEKRTILGNFYQEEILKNYGCYQCSLLPACGGMCPKEWHEGRIPCPSMKYNIQDRLLLHLATQTKNK